MMKMGTTEQNKDLMKDLYDLDFLIPLVLLRGKLSGMKEGLVRFKIAKIAAWLLVSSEISSVQEGVFLYRFGPYLLGFEDALADLVRKNILEVIIDAGGQTRFCLTDEGQRWILSRLRDGNYKRTSALEREIDRCIFTPIPDLIMEIAEKSPFFNPTKRSIGDKELIRFFDWRNVGDGKVHGYHYTLLRSFYRLEDHFHEEFRKACAKIEAGESDYRYRSVDYSVIPDVIASDCFFKDKGKEHTMRYIFNKGNPRSIREDKFEGKNYIGNLWYIYSAINIIHVLTNLAPTIDEIARVCLALYEYAVEREVSFSDIRKMRESAIRPDMHRLVKYGILTRKKIKRHHIYTIRAKKIIDSFTSNTYSVLDENKIIYLYNEKIRPKDPNISFIKEIAKKKRFLNLQKKNEKKG